MSGQAPQPHASGQPTSAAGFPSAPDASGASAPQHATPQPPSTKGRRVRRRPSFLWSLVASLFDIVLTGAVLLLLNWPPLRDGLFALQVQHGSHVTSVPLLNRGFIAAVVPVLDGVIVFAFAVRLLARIVGTRGWTLALGLLARILGGLAIVYAVVQPVIFSIDRSVPARPLGPGSLQPFAEHWGRVALLVSLVFVAIGIVDQLIAMARHRRQRAG